MSAVASTSSGISRSGVTTRDEAAPAGTRTDPAALARRQAIASTFKATAHALQIYLVTRMLPAAVTIVCDAFFLVATPP